MNISRAIIKFHPYSATIGSLLLFASWAVTNSLVEQHKAAASAMREVVASEQRFRDHFRLFFWTRTVDRNLKNLSVQTQQRDNVQMKYAEAVMMAARQNDWSEVYRNEVNDYMDSALILRGAAQSLVGTLQLKQDIASTFERVSEINSRYGEIEQTLHRANEIIGGIEKSGGVVSDEDARTFSESAAAFEKEAERIRKSMFPLENEMLILWDRLRIYAVSETERASSVASIAQFVSYIAYAVGTLLVVWSKFFESEVANKKAAARADEA